VQIEIDSHLHLWDSAHLSYPWLKEVPGIDRAFSLADYDADASGFVFVECTGSMRDDVSKDEVEWVESLALVDPRIKGIVAHASLERGEATQAHLEWLASRSLVKGVRRLLQGELDPRFCLQPAFLDGVLLLAAHNLPFDVCVYHHQMPAVVELVRSVPEVQFVLDHAGKPAIKSGNLGDWLIQIEHLASLPNVVCKLSGLITEADPMAWTPRDILPVMQHVLRCFGPNRVLYGSDWPVVLLASELSGWNEVVFGFLSSLSTEKQEALLGLNAKRVYAL